MVGKTTSDGATEPICERKDITEAIETVNGEQSAVSGTKFIQNGQLFIRCGEQVFDAMGRLVK